MTYPLIGNYGMAAEDYETLTPTIGALIVREYNDDPSNFRSVDTLGEVMSQYGIAGISGVDTRKLNRSIRDFGSRRALVTDAATQRDKEVRRKRLRFGLVFQNFQLFPHYSVLRNVSEAPILHGENKTEVHDRAMELLKKMGLGVSMLLVQLNLLMQLLMVQV